MCDVLQIDFQLKPEVRVELTDKEKILVQAQQEADAVKEDKLLEYKKFLEKERENFEKLKKETVEKLQNDLAQFGFSGEPAEKLADQQRWESAIVLVLIIFFVVVIILAHLRAFCCSHDKIVFLLLKDYMN